MKKILILSMTCNLRFFIDEESHVVRTWAKDIIDGKYPNIDYYSYTASSDGKYHISYKNHKIYVPSGDTSDDVTEKTVKCFKFIQALGMKYDYIFRTNTSTYINVYLLNLFVQELYDPYDLYTCMIHVHTDDIYPQGNAMLLSNVHIDTIISDNTIRNFPKMYSSWYDNNINHDFRDDNYIGVVLNSLFANYDGDVTGKYKSFGIVGLSYFAFTRDFEYNFDAYDLSGNIAISYRSNISDNDQRYVEMFTSEKIHNKIMSYDKNEISCMKVYEHIYNGYYAFYHPEGYITLERLYNKKINELKLNEKASCFSNVM